MESECLIKRFEWHTPSDLPMARAPARRAASRLQTVAIGGGEPPTQSFSLGDAALADFSSDPLCITALEILRFCRTVTTGPRTSEARKPRVTRVGAKKLSH